MLERLGLRRLHLHHHPSPKDLAEFVEGQRLDVLGAAARGNMRVDEVSPGGRVLHAAAKVLELVERDGATAREPTHTAEDATAWNAHISDGPVNTLQMDGDNGLCARWVCCARPSGGANVNNMLCKCAVL